MGTMNHDAIVVTGWSEDAIRAAHRSATELKLPVSNLTPGGWNGYVSFLIAPDGSKEFWGPSDSMNRARAVFLNGIRATIGLSFVHVRWGELEKTPEHDWGTLVECKP